MKKLLLVAGLGLMAVGFMVYSTSNKTTTAPDHVVSQVEERRAFPAQKQIGECYNITPDCPHLIVQIDKECGRAIVMMPSGYQFFTKEPGVLRLKETKYFELNATGPGPRDVITEVRESEIDFNKVDYYNIGP